MDFGVKELPLLAKGSKMTRFTIVTFMYEKNKVWIKCLNPLSAQSLPGRNIRDSVEFLTFLGDPTSEIYPHMAVGTKINVSLTNVGLAISL